MPVNLEQETLTALPARYETRRFDRGSRGGLNFAAASQENTSVQVMEGCVIGCVQNNIQINIVVIFQQ